ncbi:hypothetical protein [Novosphingobium mangrovi (ex Huang et al. 2023)]|uniref:Tryptophan halogenase n=1 Tax=Novosphingobium mangrovi (ex Huang et al. 2023) TaxID=2976432 RepID=A0ABT2I9G8_9SPHN|nr:hypothetical protein [Novosphingobium mangrovi (ex Huang et al. 2023)]MCT2401459.1 hypothetical protein [Novosphingobium mangrovi (ex Huang et al. 2023)]
MTWTVDITGGGVAAACCDHLLGQAGATVRWMPDARAAVPALMLSDAARALLRETLGLPDLFSDRPRITRRIVAWGGQDPVSLPHQAAMLGAGDLDFAPSGDTGMPGQPIFTISTTHPVADTPIVRFGNRTGETAPVRLLEPDDADACWIEAVEDGWLFMIPSSASSGWLLAIGAGCAQLMGQSRYLAPRIAVDADRVAQFDTTPRMLSVMADQGTLLCGSTSMAFDPICGDGTALAVRQAILASAIVRACHEGEDSAPLIGHYRAMMTAAMRRHLRLSSEFYTSGGTGPWWRAQQEALADGFAACSARLEREPPPRYTLEGFRLVRRELAA